MNNYIETNDTITLTTASVSVGLGSHMQLRLRSKRQTPIRVTCNGEEYQIPSGSVTPILNGDVIVYKDDTESEVFIERSTISGSPTKIVKITKQQYDAMATRDDPTIYVVGS